MRRLLSCLLFLLILLAPIVLEGCGEANPGDSIEIAFFPDTPSISASTAQNTTRRFIIHISRPSGSGGADTGGEADAKFKTTGPLQGVRGRLIMPLHAHLPAPTAAGVIRFLDENGDAISIASPVTDGPEGNAYEFITDENGDFSFVVQFPVGNVGYSFEIWVLVGNTLVTNTVTVSVASSLKGL